MKAIFIILLLLITFTSISTSPSQAPDAVQSTRLIDAVRVFSLNALQVKEMIAQAVNKLTAPRLKDKHDICVWKICSRPLKPAYKGPKAKAEIVSCWSGCIWSGIAVNTSHRKSCAMGRR